MLGLVMWIGYLSASGQFRMRVPPDHIGIINSAWVGATMTVTVSFLLGMAAFFVGAPLLYRLVLGETAFGANTWFFEGIVVPLAEEGFFRGILLSMLLWGFGKISQESMAGWPPLFSAP